MDRIPTTPPPPPPPVFSWTGFYIGGNLGGAWARGTVSDSLFGLSASSDRSGFIGGGQLGVNYQFSNIVLGFTASREIQMFKVGLNYRFGSLFGGGYGGAY
jgi:hypothetical protein